jgi:hypothetical protein
MKKITIFHYRKVAKSLFNLRKESKLKEEKELYNRVKKRILNKPFYRLEKDGLGPWYSFRTESESREDWIDGTCKRLGLCRDDSYVSDLWQDNKDEFLSACYSYSNLRKWFSDNEWKTLKNEGFKVKKHYINSDFKDIFLCDNQVLIVKKDSSRKKIISNNNMKWKRFHIRNNIFLNDLINNL